MQKTWIDRIGFLIFIGILVYLAVGMYSINSNSNGTRDKDITTKLDQIIANQRGITAELNGISKDVATSIGRIEVIEAGNSRIENFTKEALGRLAESDALIKESGRINSENERIIREILKRNESQNK